MPNQHALKSDPLRGKKSGKWSKFGGAVYGLVKEKIEDEWFCQVCARKVPKELPPFNYELFPGEFIRVCNVCKSVINKIPKGNNFIRYRKTMIITRNIKD